MTTPPRRALVTGVSRILGIAAAVADQLRRDGWDVVTAGLPAYDARMPWGADAADGGGPPIDHEVDLSDPAAPARLLAAAATDGPISALVLCHTESVDADIMTTTVESFDRHMAVNARAAWLLIKAFADQLPPLDPGLDPHHDAGRRVVAITSDHTAFNLPYGASKGALDRIVLAAAVELADQRVVANVVNPGAVDTGWMSEEIERAVLARNLQPRVGRPNDTADLVGFLCSPQGRWINGQLLYSDGGLR